MDTNLKKQIDRFLEAFMKIEYNEREHIIAREHYRQVFHEIIPKYFTIPTNIKGG